jgi:hypothetical protein
MRCPLPECVHGRVSRDSITLRAGLSAEQELPVLVHELAHWLEHSDPDIALPPAVCEYEAEAVEQIVLSRLGLARPEVLMDEFGQHSPTDGLLPASIVRVRSASSRICRALGLEPQRPGSEPQTPVQFEAAPGEEIILEYEQHGMGDLLGSPEPL